MRHVLPAIYHRVATLGLLVLFFCTLPMARAADRYVTQCGDYLPGDTPIAGSLRKVIADASNVDRVFLTNLSTSCERILLKAPIQINQAKLTLVGKVITAFPSGKRSWYGILDGQNQHRALVHVPLNGLLKLEDMRIEHGYTSPTGVPAEGGCIRVAGRLILDDSWVESCQAVPAAGQIALGGAISALGEIELYDSTIRNARALAVNKVSEGGALASEARVLMRRSRVLDSEARSSGTAGKARGGGVSTKWLDMREGSEISRNRALVSSGSPGDSGGGGAYIQDMADVHDSRLENNVASTIEVGEEGAEPGAAGIGFGGALFFHQLLRLPSAAAGCATTGCYGGRCDLHEWWHSLDHRHHSRRQRDLG